MSSGAPCTASITTTLSRLATRGWIPLRSMSMLLGYAHPTGIYGRQRSKNPIPTILIGGAHRVYEDVVIETLKNMPEKDQVASKTMLGIYRRLQKEHTHV